MQNRKLKIKKEIVANLSDTESSQFRGGRRTQDYASCGCDSIDICTSAPLGFSCLCYDPSWTPGTACCGPTYADCTNLECNP